MSILEQRLRDLAGEIAYPPTPRLAPAVAERLRVKRRRPGLRRFTRVSAIALIGLLLVAGAAVGLEPRLRHGVLEWLGLRSVRIEHRQRVPTLPPGSAGRGLGLGRRANLADAVAAVSFHPLVPRQRADEKYVADSPPGGKISFVYRPRRAFPRAPGTATGLLITEFRGNQPREYLDKSLGPGTTISFVRVGGDRGVWIDGAPHEFAYVDARGQARPETLRLAGNTLLWNHHGVLLRLEAHVSKRTALRIAASLR